MSNKPAFAGGDQTYLRDVQYRDGTKLDVRTAIHVRFSTSTITFPDFVASQIEWSDAPRVLECGTGTGRFWDNDYAPKNASLTLTDLSPGMVDLAVERATANGFDTVEGRECDIQDLPFEDDSFDVVVANHMLYHVPDPDRALAEVARVLRHDGHFLAATNGYGHMGEMNDAVAEVFGQRESEALYEVFGIDSGEARLRQQFSAITWLAHHNDLVVRDPEAAVAYGLSYPPGDEATEDQAQQFAAAIERRFVKGSFLIRTRAGVFVCAGLRGS